MKIGFKPKLGLKTALLILLALSLLFGYFSRLVHRGKEQVSIVESLAMARPGPYSNVPRSIQESVGTIPSLFGFLPGSKNCVAIESLDFSGRGYSSPRDVDSGELENINKLTYLKRLALWRTDVTSGDLAALDGLKQLELLDLNQCPNLDQDAVAAELYRWPKLRRVVFGPKKHSYIMWSNFDPLLFGKGVTNKGLKSLAEHPQKPVRELKIRGFNRRSMGLVLKLPKLSALEIVLDAGSDPQLLNGLAFLPNLKTLHVSGIEKVGLPFLRHNRADIAVTFSPEVYRSLAEVLKAWENHVDTLRFTFHSRATKNGLYQVTGFQSGNEVRLSAGITETGWFHDQRITRIIVQQAAGSGNHRSSLNLGNERAAIQIAREDLVGSLNQFSSLKELVLRDVRIPSNEGFSHLNTLCHLAISTVIDCESEIDLANYPQLKSLAAETYFGGKVRITGWKHLKKIRRIYYHGNSFDLETLQKLPNPRLLEELDIKWFHPQTRHEFVAELSRFQNLKTCFFRNKDWEWHQNLHAHLPNLTNYVGRMGIFDPAEDRFGKAFSQLNETDAPR